MKRIEAIIRPHKLEAVMQSLREQGGTGITVMDTVGFGRQQGQSVVYQGDEQPVDLVPKRMVVIYTDDDKAPALVHSISEIARTGQIGDGKIVVSDLETAHRIRTGEEGEIAL